MKSIKEFFENPIIRLQIQDCLSVRNGVKTVYEVAEEIATNLCDSYGHIEFKPLIWEQSQEELIKQGLLKKVTVSDSPVGLIKGQIFEGKYVVTDIYKEQKDNVQKAIDNLQRELEKAARIHLTIKLKGTTYPKELITIESASREI